jgi:hypothetical protein
MGTQVTSTIDLDTAFDGDDRDLESKIHGMAREYGVTAEIIEPRGPAGGWPIVRYAGRTADLARMIKIEFDPGDVEEVEDLLAIMYMRAKGL